jgi:hypothetical protein
MLTSLRIAAPVLCAACAALTCPSHAGDTVARSNGRLQIDGSRQTGAIVTRRSLEPTPLD